MKKPALLVAAMALLASISVQAQTQPDMQRLEQAGTKGTAVPGVQGPVGETYSAAIMRKIRNGTSYTGSMDVPGNPKVVFKLEQLPTGEIVSVTKVTSSGIPAWDDAVERGINNSSPLPKKKDGTVERLIEVGFTMKSQH
jgi:colicin import membrane protein